MTKKDDIDVIVEIAERAEKINLNMFDRMSLIMDLQHTHELFNLRLEELLTADDFNFAHDIVGIQNNFNRKTLQMDNLFLPRYSSTQKEEASE